MLEDVTKSSDKTARAKRGGEDVRRPRLVVLAGGRLIAHDLPSAGDLVIGRGAGAAIRIDDASVSREHAMLRVKNGRIEIEDLKSSNGTRVAGAALVPKVPAPMSVFQLVEVGQAVLAVGDEDFFRRVFSHATNIDRVAPIASAGASALGTAMQEIDRLVGIVAGAKIGVLLIGETGVGKGATAEAIHRRSPRAAKPFVRINCAAVPETLIEAELFGFERGAFTGAAQAKPGLLEAAHEGTLLLDEIGEMSRAVQPKLLHVLESGEVVRLGATKPRKVDVRFLAATNRDLATSIAQGEFREDLFFRISSVTIEIPPLRDRRTEIPALARKLLKAAAEEMGRPAPSLADNAVYWMAEQPWPGNVRQLKAVLERAVLFSTNGVIERGHLAESASERRGKPARADARPASLRDELESLEKRRIVEALEQSNGNQTKAAALLKMPLRTLVKRIEAYGLARPRK